MCPRVRGDLVIETIVQHSVACMWRVSSVTAGKRGTNTKNASSKLPSWAASTRPHGRNGKPTHGRSWATRTRRGRQRPWSFGASPPTQARAAPMVRPLGITGCLVSVTAPTGLCCLSPAGGVGMPRAASEDATRQQRNITARHGTGQQCAIWDRRIGRRCTVAHFPGGTQSVASSIPTSPGSPMPTKSSCRIALATRTWAMLLRLG